MRLVRRVWRALREWWCGAVSLRVDGWHQRRAEERNWKSYLAWERQRSAADKIESLTVQEVREQAIIDASDLEIRILPTVGPDEPDIVDRMYALPEWAQEWVAGSVVGGVCFVDETRDVWYVAMPFDVCISRIGGGTLSGEVVATKRGDLPYTRLEAAEAMAAHWAKMEAEGDA